MPLTAEQDARAEQMVQRAMQDEEIPAFICVKVKRIEERPEVIAENPLLRYIGDPLFWLGLLMVSAVIWIARILLGL